MKKARYYLSLIFSFLLIISCQKSNSATDKKLLCIENDSIKYELVEIFGSKKDTDNNTQCKKFSYTYFGEDSIIMYGVNLSDIMGILFNKNPKFIFVESELLTKEFSFKYVRRNNKIQTKDTLFIINKMMDLFSTNIYRRIDSVYAFEVYFPYKSEKNHSNDLTTSSIKVRGNKVMFKNAPFSALVNVLNDNYNFYFFNTSNQKQLLNMEFELLKFEDLVKQLNKKDIYLEKKKIELEILNVEKRI
ncbi:MAG: hypothetical protein JXR34_05730 [Bacteroidales bacterium]|nr:hypothetical protein [Bacteroidales bacterium]